MKSENNVQLHGRINAALKGKLVFIQTTEGYWDRTVREVIRKADQLRKVQAQLRDLERLMSRASEPSLASIRGTVMGFQDFKLRHHDWHPGLVAVEKDLLNSYMAHLRAKSYKAIDTEAEGEEEGDDDA